MSLDHDCTACEHEIEDGDWAVHAECADARLAGVLGDLDAALSLLSVADGWIMHARAVVEAAEELQRRRAHATDCNCRLCETLTELAKHTAPTEKLRAALVASGRSPPWPGEKVT